MDTGYRVVHESERYLVICSELSDAVKVFERSTDSIIVASARQLDHLDRCCEELDKMYPVGSTDPGPLHVLIEDFAGAVCHDGQDLERAFFKLSPKSRARSALARAGTDATVSRQGKWDQIGR